MFSVSLAAMQVGCPWQNVSPWLFLGDFHASKLALSNFAWWLALVSPDSPVWLTGLKATTNLHFPGQ